MRLHACRGWSGEHGRDLNIGEWDLRGIVERVRIAINLSNEPFPEPKSSFVFRLAASR